MRKPFGTVVTHNSSRDRCARSLQLRRLSTPLLTQRIAAAGDLLDLPLLDQRGHRQTVGIAERSAKSRPCAVREWMTACSPIRCNNTRCGPTLRIMSQLKIPPGRDEQFHAFEQALWRSEQTGREVVVFFGPGGQGKTELCSAIAGLTRDTLDQTRHPVCLIDFKVHPTTPAEALYALRTGLKVGGVFAKPMFDVAFIAYQQQLHPGIDLKRRFPEMFFESHLFAGTSDAAALLAGFVTDLVHQVPFTSMVEKYGRRLIDTLSRTRAIQLQSTLQSLLAMHHEAIIEALPSLLAQDVSHGTDPTIRPIFLVDHYERLWAQGMERDGVLHYDSDRWFRLFCEHLSRGVCVVFSRERLDDWSQLSSQWTSETLTQIALPDLSARQVVQLLKTAQVEDKAIRKRIVRVAQGHPFYVRTQLDQYRNIVAQGKVPSLEQFGFSKPDVIKRFVGHLESRDSLSLKVLAFPESVDRDLFEHLAEKMPDVFHGLTFDGVTGYSFFQRGGAGAAVMHAVMRSGLQMLTDARTRTRANTAAFEFYAHRSATRPKNDTEGVYGSMLLAAKHRASFDAVGFARWLAEVQPDGMGEPFIPLLDTAIATAERHGLHSQQVECLWRLAWVKDDPEWNRDVLRRALKVAAEPGAVSEKRHFEIKYQLARVLFSGSEADVREVTDRCVSLAAECRATAALDAWAPFRILSLWGMACGKLGDYQNFETRLREAFELMPNVVPDDDKTLINLRGFVTRLINYYRSQARFDDVREFGRSLSARLEAMIPAEEAAKVSVGPATQADAGSMWQGISVALTDDPAARSVYVAEFVKRLKDLCRFSDADLGRLVHLPGSTVTALSTGALALFSEMNIGLVINAKGKVCLVYDRPFRCVPDNDPVHVRYDLTHRRMYVVFETHFAFAIDWVSTDEIDSYLRAISKILLIRMDNKKPVEGYDLDFIACDLPSDEGPGHLRGDDLAPVNP